MFAAIIPADPEALGYLLILAGTVLVMIGALGVAFWSAARARRARRRADRLLNDLAHADGLIADLRKAVNITDGLLADLRRRYGTTLEQHWDRGNRPLWTRPGPPAEQTVIMSAVAETAILTLAGTSLADPT